MSAATALLHVPAYHTGEHTLETSTRSERLAAFADDSIFRSYTDADYQARLRECGFDMAVYRAEVLEPELSRRMSMKREVLHVCRPRS